MPDIKLTCSLNLKFIVERSLSPNLQAGRVNVVNVYIHSLSPGGDDHFSTGREIGVHDSAVSGADNN